MSQITAPQITMDAAVNGMPADSHAPKDVLTGKAVKEALPFGRLVVVNTANGDGAVMLPTGAGDITNLSVGVVLRTHSLESSLSGEPQYEQNSAVPVLRKGRIFAQVQDAVAEGGQVFATNAAAHGTFRSDSTGATLVPGARYRSSTSGAGLAIVEINQPA